jgi:hypothetical protein
VNKLCFRVLGDKDAVKDISRNLFLVFLWENEEIVENSSSGEAMKIVWGIEMNLQ